MVRSSAHRPPPHDRPPPGAGGSRSFGIFWAGQTLSVVGDAFALIALPLLVLQATGSVARMGLLTAAAGGASLVAGVFAGVVVDRLDRRKLLVATDLARMALYAVIPVAWAFGPRVWLLYVVLPLCEAVGMLFSVTYVTVVRALVAPDLITRANGRLGATASAAGVAGPVCAGLVVSRFGAATAVGVDAASFAVSAACMALVRFHGDTRALSAARAGAPATGDAARAGRDTALRRLGRDLRAGVTFLRGHPVLRSLTVLLTFFVFLTLGLNDLIIYHLEHDLGESDRTVGVVFAVAALGSITGALMVAPVRRRFGFGPTWIGAVAVSGLAVAGIGWASDVPGVALPAAAFLGCTGVAGTCSMSLRQEVTPEHLLGRVTSAFWTLHYCAAPAGAALLTWTAQRVGTAPVTLTAGVCCLLIAAAAAATPVHRPRPERLADAV
ncbi:MFS transporter [Streptomyces sp. HPF1205]|uniref:MFS transporter n=1 Tax=Streptomyces sp. HPF1205 TaxID=2873262 RepID=UPI001CEC5548|nr:MFS transporter [Streptomyces sp. HPF1205]